ncbi:MAG: RNA-processing protein [Candidatus Aenigmarchaeota archaeon]|nr:RNA-processing protein [Candidatus Aenigmarchaeota archaeon]
MEEIIRIPESRIGLIIGEGGKVKAELQKSFGAKLTINEDGTVEITSEEGLNIYKMKKAVEGIARGLSLEIVLCLCDDDYDLEIIHLEEILGKNKNVLGRYKSRLIGTGGKIKKIIEKKTDTDIAVHGKTVAIIGKFKDIADAKSAIELILQGNDFNSVFASLDNRLIDR